MAVKKHSLKRDVILEELINTFGPSSHEDLFIQDKIKGFIEESVDEVVLDRNNNLYGIVHGDDSLPRVMFNAHSDTVGFMITFIDDKGFIFTKDLGDVLDRKTLPGQRVRIFSNRNRKMVDGYYTIKSVHFLTEGKTEQVDDDSEVAIDIGAKNIVEAKKHVSIGDVGVLHSPPSYLLNNGRILAAGLDDRAGVYTLLRVADRVKKADMKRKCPAIFAFTTNEETATNETNVAANRYPPHVGLVIDVALAADYLREDNEDTIAKKYGQIALDKGACIARGVGVNRKLADLVEEIAKKRGVRYQIEPDLNSSGTENKALRVSGQGVATALISIPMRSSHSPVENVSLTDIESVIDLNYYTYRELSRGTLAKEFMR